MKAQVNNVKNFEFVSKMLLAEEVTLGDGEKVELQLYIWPDRYTISATFFRANGQAEDTVMDTEPFVDVAERLRAERDHEKEKAMIS